MRTFHFILLSFILSVPTNCVFAQQNKIDSLEKQLRILEQKAESYPVDTNKVILLTAITWDMANYNRGLDTALSYGQEALAISKKIKWNKGMAESYSSIAEVYRSQSNYTQAVNNYLEALHISRDMKEKDWTATCLYFIGQVYQDQGNYPIALDYLLQALRISEGTANTVDIARDLTYIGMIYAEIDDNPNALNYYLQALKKNEQLNDKYWIAINLQSIAAIYNNENEYAKALDYYSRVLKMSGGDTYSIYETLMDIGDVYKNQSLSINDLQNDTAWANAMDYYSRAFKIATKVDDAFTAGLSLNGMGSLYLKRNKVKEADAALNKALKLLKDQNTPEALKDCYFNLSKLDSVRGDWKNSLIYYRHYATINDSLFNKKKSRQIAQVQIKYETDKKQGEIEILNKDNELKNLRIQQQSKNILLIISVAVILLLSSGGYAWYRSRRIKQQSLKQISEAKLASLKSLMDKHFIFSSLHSIDTFLMNNDSEAASDYLVKYSKLIRTILEMSNQAEVSLGEEISLCRSYLDLEKIRYNNSFDYDFLIDQTISLQQTQFPSMLLQPLVENAVKHGISSLTENEMGKKGFIRVVIDKEKDKLVCTVTDNGKGLGFSGTTSKSHRSYSGKGIIERVRVYNNIVKNKASFVLKDNYPGVAAVLTLPYIFRKQSVAV
ncbi:MAG: tetratricopeptide repeat protein [Chitinophagales bacterium]